MQCRSLQGRFHGRAEALAQCAGLHHVTKARKHVMDHVCEALFCGSAQQLTEANLKTDPKAGLHKLANGLVAHAVTDGVQEQRPQDLRLDEHHLAYHGGYVYLKDLHKNDFVTCQVSADKLCMGHGIGNVFNRRCCVIGCWI